MKEIVIKSTIQVAQPEELSADEQALVQLAISATERAYAPYSHFQVGAAVLLENGEMLPGCNQENAAFPVTLCAERTALFAAGAQWPDVAVTKLAIAARGTDGQLTDEPVTPCGSCRQAIIETETRFGRQVKILLYGRNKVYVIDGIRPLMPLSFSDF